KARSGLIEGFWRWARAYCLRQPVHPPFRSRSFRMNHSSNGSSRVPGASTVAVHAGELRQKAGNAITDSIVCSATYTFANTHAVLDYLEKKEDREEYGRYGNP